MRTILAVLVGLALLSCSNDNEKKVDGVPSSPIPEQVKLPENHFLGCWEEEKDSTVIYWCFDSTEVNRDGYIHPYFFKGDTLEVSTLKYQFTLEGDKCLLMNLLDSSKIEMDRSVLTESPSAF